MKISGVENSVIYAQLQNWRNFCRYHIGDWYGNWTLYNSSGELIDCFKCVRSVRLNKDGSQIEHQNRFFTANSQIPLEDYSCSKKPITQVLSLDKSFSWGSTRVNPNSFFSFETGFRHQNRRESVFINYCQRGNLDSIFTISEHLGNFAQNPFPIWVNQFSDWHGTLTMISPEQIVSPTIAILWMQLESLSKDNLIFHLDNKLISLPRKLKSNKKFILAIESLFNPAFVQRGIRYFDTCGFIGFTLESFTHQTEQTNLNMEY